MTFIKKWGMTIRQFLLVLFTTFLIFALLTHSNTLLTINTVRTSTENDYMNLIKEANSFLDQYINSIKSIIILLSSELMYFDKTDEEGTLTLLRNYSEYTNYNIKTLYFIKPDGMVLCGKQVLYDIFGNEHLTQLYEQAVSGLPGIKWSDPYYSTLSGYTVAFHTMIRNKSGEFVGVIVAECSIDGLSETLNKYLVGTQYSYVLLSSLGTLIVYNVNNNFIPVTKNTYPPKILDNFILRLKQLIKARTNIIDIDSFHKPLKIYKSQDNSFGWNIFLITDKTYLNSTISAIMKKFYISLILCFLALSIISFLTAIWLSSPIRKLVIKMRSITNISSLSKIENKRSDEIGQLIKSYNYMIDNIHHLLHNVRSYELKMLRSQIGPHFLYNTLSCISILAKQQKLTEVRQTINSLINLLSFSFDRHDEFVELKDELSSLEDYIYIQKIRFGDIFEYKVDIDKNCETCLLPKLTLQPIVENSILHGIMANSSKLKKIVVKARIRNNKLTILIYDNGIGMSNKKIKELLDISDEKNRHNRFSSIGISNINQRMILYYGPEYQLKIRSSTGTGTVVRITIPCNN